MRIKLFILTVLCVVAFNPLPAQQTKRASVALKHGANRIGKRTDADMQRWREHGLGQFIHWGVYAIPGGHWNGQAYGGAAEWIRAWKDMPNEDYDNLYKQFNPVNFHAGQWAKMAKHMGVKYMIITTKHHDGFCIWPSRYTGYTIQNTPYRKDILKEIIDAYNKEGIDVHLYFSIIDWNHPDYRASVETEKDKAAYEEFKAFTRNQLVELLTNYPTTKGLWFDGTWEKAWVDQAEFADKLDRELRTLRPGLIIGSRFRADENGKRHYDTNGDLIGDYDQGWERDLPDDIGQLNGADWDCVMTVPENQWGYNTDWKGYVKTSYDLIEMMVKSVSLGGNFVLNFGPDGKGAIRPEETRLAGEIGDWMKVNSEAIYGCSYVSLKKQGWGHYTAKGNKVYMTVFNRPLNNLLSVEVPRGGMKPVKACLLQDGQPVEIRNAGRNKRNNSLYHIAIPDGFPDDRPFVIVMEVEEQADKDTYQQALT